MDLEQEKTNYVPGVFRNVLKDVWRMIPAALDGKMERLRNVHRKEEFQPCAQTA